MVFFGKSAISTVPVALPSLAYIGFGATLSNHLVINILKQIVRKNKYFFQGAQLGHKILHPGGGRLVNLADRCTAYIFGVYRAPKFSISLSPACSRQISFFPPLRYIFLPATPQSFH
jgi:hypothetical protein